MKFIHISDLHILPRPQTIKGVDVCARLDAAVDSIIARFDDAELCMVTGDIVHTGDDGAYGEARRILDRLPMPWHMLMGNHDDDGARRAFPDLPWQNDGSLQYVLETPVGQFIALDSSIGGDVDAGRMTPARLEYLREQLVSARSSGKDVYLFMHHVPFDIGIPWVDQIKLENGDDLWDVLKDFGNIKHMFMGHIHRPTHGSWHGIPFSTVRSTAHQVVFGLENEKQFIGESPAYAVVMFGDEQVIIHDHNFADETLAVVSS